MNPEAGESSTRALVKGSDTPSLNLQHAWFEATRNRSWRSLALVPVQENTPTIELARGFGRMASQELTGRVLVVNASLKDCRLRGDSGESPKVDVWNAMTGVEFEDNDATQFSYDFMDFSKLLVDEAEQALAFAPKLIDRLTADESPHSTTIFAVDSLLTQTRAIPLARAVDRVVLCVTLGVTPVRSARRLIEIVGRDKIVGSIVFRPKAQSPDTSAVDRLKRTRKDG
ncbi:hypothetical protein ACFL6C_06295 [Myxococcota bacterium]